MKAKDGGEVVSPIHLLVISPSQENRTALKKVLHDSGLAPTTCSSLSEGRKFMEDHDVRIVICDFLLPHEGLRSIVEEMAKRPNPPAVIAVSRAGEWDEYLDALRIGAFDYMALPVQRDEARRILISALRESFPRSGFAMARAASK